MGEKDRKSVEIAVFKGDILFPESEIKIWVYRRYGFEDITIKPIEIQKVHDFDIFLIITASTKYLVLNYAATDNIKICEMPDALALSDGCEFYYTHLPFLTKTNEKVDCSLRDSEVINKSFTRKYLPDNLRVVKYKGIKLTSSILEDDTTTLYCLHLIDDKKELWCEYFYMI